MPTVASPLLEKQQEVIEPPKYSDTEETYLGGLRKRLEHAKNARDTAHDEFDGMDYATYYNQNERLANTYIQPKNNREDSNFQSGTIRTKLFALLSSVVNLDLAGDISAFDENGLKIQAMGDAMEDVILKTNELDTDDEKKMLRQYELLKQGDVFVEEIWDKRQKKQKKMENAFSGKLGIEWETKLKDAFERPTRNIIPGINVYLGDITKYGMDDQPYIFTVDSVPYDEAYTIFGEWDRWGNVPKKLIAFDPAKNTTTWTLLESQENYVEIVRYQDKWNNEFAILLNGVLMTPVGLPLPWGYEEYNIAQQGLEPIHAKFAYHKSLVFRLRNKVAIYDEMMKLGVLKTQKSFMPPRYNLSGRVVSSRVFMPAKINHGIAPGTLPPIEGENEGITNSELAMITQMQESIDAETTSPTFQGQQAQGNPTATEIIELQRQAKQMLGLTIFSVSMLEWKLEWLRLQNLIAHWFNPQDQVVDEIRGVLRDKYRKVSVPRQIEGEGMGMRMVIPSPYVSRGSEAIEKAEDMLTQERGMPIRLIFLDPAAVTNAKLCWQIVITPREKRTSEAQKLLFRAFMADAVVFGPTLNLSELQDEFASVWGKNPQKLFKSPEQLQQEQIMTMTPEGTPSPQTMLPTPEKAAGR